MGKYYSIHNEKTEEELLRFARKDSLELIPEAFSDFIDVLHDRKFNKDLIDNLKKRYSFIDEKHIDQLALKFINQECPICKKTTGINAISLSELFSIIVFTKFKEKTYIGCKSCLKDEMIRANIYSLALGPWGIPIGIIGTPIIILLNIIRVLKLDINKPTEELKEYVRKNIDYIFKLVE